jgi:hypothetical protein
MESSLCVQQSISAGMSPRKLNNCFDAFTAGAAEKYFGELTSGKLAESRREFTCQFRDMTLKHRGTAAIKLLFQRGDYSRMVMPDIVNTISREKI